MRKFEKEKGAISIMAIVALVVVVGAGFVVYQYFGQKQRSSLSEQLVGGEQPGVEFPTKAPQEGQEEPLGPALREEGRLEVNFSEAGNVLNWDSRTESYTDEWTFLYEKPTNPAIAVKLTFTETSLCNLGQGEEVCDKKRLTNGDWVELRGNLDGDQVTVINLKKLEMPQGL